MEKPLPKYIVTVGTYLFLLFCTLLLLYPVFLTRGGTFIICGDNLNLTYPFLNKLSISLHQGYLPVWDANTFGGKNFAGELQTGIFYPLNLLWCFLFGADKGIGVFYIDLLVALHYFICVTGMYSVGRVFRLPRLAAIGSTLVFSFTGVLAQRSHCQVFIFYGLTLLPWAIYFLGKYYREPRHRKWLIFAGLIGGFQILAGHIQPFFHTLFIAAIMMVFYEYRGRKNWRAFCFNIVINISILLFFAFLLALPQIYYAAEYLSSCYRQVGGPEGLVYIGPTRKVPIFIYMYRLILNPSDVENFVSPNLGTPYDLNYLYMGILPLFLCIVFLIRCRFLQMAEEHRKLKKILTVILFVGILSVLGYLTFFSYILYSLPFVSGIRELSRYVILISFSDALLVGLALTYISQLGDQFFKNASKRNLFVISLLCLNTLYWTLFQEKFIPLNISIPFLLGFLFFVVLMTIRPKSWFRLLAVVFILGDLFLNPVNDQLSNVYRYPSKFYGRDRVVDFLETTYGKYRVSIDMDNWATRRNLGDIYTIQTKFGYGGTVNMAYFNFIHSTADPEVDDLLNIKYIITDQRLDSNFIFKDSSQNLNLYQRKNCYPRCYWQHQLGRPGVKIELENKDSIRQLAYSDLYQKWSIDCSIPDTLIFSENCYPGWKCYDNQKEVQIFPATIRNYPPLFRAIVLDKGHHLLEFKYSKVFHWF